MHMNDTYEIGPVSGGKLGGLARVTTLKKEMLAENPNTYLTLAGDLYGPSALSNGVIIDGEPLSGKQVVGVMNTVGVDFMGFGDHEFDLFKEAQVRARLAETQFPIISATYFDTDGSPFANVAAHGIVTATNAAGDQVRVGFFGIAKKPNVSDLPLTYKDAITATREQVAELDGQTNILVAITHFPVKEDAKLAQMFPEIDVVVGGDDHENMAVESPGFATVYKADSNARSVQIIDLYYDTATDALRIESRVQPITDAIIDDPTSLAEVTKWQEIGFEALRAQGLDPERVIYHTPVDLDGFANSIRNRPTELTTAIVKGLQAAAPDADLATLLTGFVRLDDVIPADSDFTEFDAVRTFPATANVVVIDVPGEALHAILTKGQESAGSGNFILPSENVISKDGIWLINDTPIDPAKSYKVVATERDANTWAESGATVSQELGLTLQQVLIAQLTAMAAAQ